MIEEASRAVILYGPPASGKSTVTDYLERLDSRFQLFPRLKSGAGRHAGYRMTTPAHVETLRAKGQVVWENERYGAIYVIDYDYLTRMIRTGVIPVLHAGQRSAVRAIRAALPGIQVTPVSLTCPRSTAAERIAARRTEDAAERLAAYDATKPFPEAELVIDTSRADPEVTASLIAHACFQGDGPRCD